MLYEHHLHFYLQLSGQLMQLLAYISEFGMAWFRLTCPFSLDWKLGACAHAQKDVNADVRVIGGAGEERGGCKVVIEGALCTHPCHVPAQLLTRTDHRISQLSHYSEKTSCF